MQRIGIKKKLSESHIGLKQSPEHIEKRARKMRGIVRSEELKKQWSESKMGNKNPMFGKVSTRKGKTGIYSKETIDKIKSARAKQKFSDETRRKMSESQKRQHALRKIQQFQ